MTWNYRIVKEEAQGTFTGEIYYIKEACYDNKSKTPSSLTIDPICPQGETIDELKKDFELMLMAFDKPTIEGKKYD